MQIEVSCFVFPSLLDNKQDQKFHYLKDVMRIQVIVDCDVCDCRSLLLRSFYHRRPLPSFTSSWAWRILQNKKDLHHELKELEREPHKESWLIHELTVVCGKYIYFGIRIMNVWEIFICNHSLHKNRARHHKNRQNTWRRTFWVSAGG